MAHGQSNRLRPAGLLASLACGLGLLAGCHSAEKKEDPTKSLDPATKQKLLGYAPATGSGNTAGQDRSSPSSLPAPQLSSANKPPPPVAIANPTPMPNSNPTYSMPTSPVNAATMGLQRTGGTSRPDTGSAVIRSGTAQPINPTPSPSPAITPPSSSALPAVESSASPTGPILNVPAMPLNPSTPDASSNLMAPTGPNGPLPTVPGSSTSTSAGSTSAIPPIPTSIPAVSGLNPPSTNAGSIASHVIPAPPLQNLSIPQEPPSQTLPPVVPLGSSVPTLPTDTRESNYPPIPSPTDFPPSGK